MNHAMAERRGELPQVSPYREVFSNIERLAECEEGLDPQAAYELYEAYLDKKGFDPVIYLSMAITSGGYARDKDLSGGEVIDRNNDFGDIAKAAFLKQHPEFSAADVILPSELGKVKGWSQSDYLLFWFHVICGPEPAVAQKVSKAMCGFMDYPGFTDKSLDTETRWQDYERFMTDYYDALMVAVSDQPTKSYSNNIQAMLMILDSEMSLGGRAEEALCRKMGIPPQFCYLDEGTIESVPAMSTSLETLHTIGASALGNNINPPDIKFIGMSKGAVNYDNGWQLGMRTTGLMNAVLTKEYYASKARRPRRHQSHNVT